jgi:hypothetical protein
MFVFLCFSVEMDTYFNFLLEMYIFKDYIYQAYFAVLVTKKKYKISENNLIMICLMAKKT